MFYEGNSYLMVGLFNNFGVSNQYFHFSDYFNYKKKTYELKIIGSTHWASWTGMWRVKGENYIPILDLEENQLTESGSISPFVQELLNYYKLNFSITKVGFKKV